MQPIWQDRLLAGIMVAMNPQGRFDTSKRASGIAVTVLIYLACAAFLSFPWLSGRVTIPWDAKAHFYPQLQFLAQSIHSGESPFWTPNVFAGSPQIADPQSLIFAPPYLLLALFDPNPSFVAFDAVAIGMLALAGIATLLLFHERGWHPAAAIMAAIAVSFGGSAAWRIQHVGEVMSLAWFVVTLYFVTSAMRRGSLVRAALAGVTAAFMVLGRDQVAFLGTYAFAIYVAASLVRLRGVALRRRLSVITVATFCGFVLVAVPLALTLSFAAQSNRAAIDLIGAGRGSLHPSALLTLVVANLFGAAGPLELFWGAPSPAWGPTDLYLARNMSVLYIGAMPIAVIAVGYVRLAFWDGIATWLLVATLACLVYALGRYTPAFEFAFHLPGVSFYRRPADATFLLGPFASILAGYLMHRLFELETGQARPLWFVAAFGAFACGVAASACVALAKGQWVVAAIPLAMALGCGFGAVASLFVAIRLAPAAPHAASVLIALAMTADIAVNNGVSESTGLPPALYDVLRPESDNEAIAFLKSRLAAVAAEDRRDRIELAAIDFHWPNASLSHRLDHDLGYNPLRLKLFNDATGAQDHVAVPSQRTFSALAPSYRSPLYGLLGVRYIATGVPLTEIDPTARPQDFPLVARTKDAFVYENPQALPRVMVATSIARVDFATMIRTGDWPNVDLRQTVLLDRNESFLPEFAAGGVARAALRGYETTNIEIEADSSSGGVLILNDVWHPWWFASVDGIEVAVLRANVMFRGVLLPPGPHRVRFRFEPIRGLFREAAQQLFPKKAVSK